MKTFFKNNAFIMLMLTGIVAGCIVGAVWPGVLAKQKIKQRQLHQAFF